jgi:hypothetical protein
MSSVIGAILLIAAYAYVVIAGGRLLWRAYHPKRHL